MRTHQVSFILIRTATVTGTSTTCYPESRDLLSAGGHHRSHRSLRKSPSNRMSLPSRKGSFDSAYRFASESVGCAQDDNVVQSAAVGRGESGGNRFGST